MREVEGWLGFLVWFWVIGGRENARVFLCGFFLKFELTFSQNLMVARVFGRKYEVKGFLVGDIKCGGKVFSLFKFSALISFFLSPLFMA